jgi:hypothetical protein
MYCTIYEVNFKNFLYIRSNELYGPDTYNDDIFEGFTKETENNENVEEKDDPFSNDEKYQNTDEEVKS